LRFPWTHSRSLPIRPDSRRSRRAELRRRDIPAARDATLVQAAGGGIRWQRYQNLLPAGDRHQPTHQRSAGLGVALYGNGGLDTSYRSNPYARFGAQGPPEWICSRHFCHPPLRSSSMSKFPGDRAERRVSALRGQESGSFGLFGAAGQCVEPRPRTTHGSGRAAGVVGTVERTTSPSVRPGSRNPYGAFEKKYSGLFADGGAFDIPESVRPGHRGSADQAIDDRGRLAANFIFRRARVVTAWMSYLKGCAGRPGGPGFGLENISVFKLGAATPFRFRYTGAGVSKSQQPVPASQTFLNILAPGVIETT